MQNNKQFRISIEQHITNIYNNVLEGFYKATSDINESPRSHNAKIEYYKYLAQKQTLESLLRHIDDGSYDSEQFYTNYLNPKTRFDSLNKIK